MCYQMPSRIHKPTILIAFSGVMVAVVNFVLYLAASTNILCHSGFVAGRAFVEPRTIIDSSIDSTNLWSIQLGIPEYGIQIVDSLLIASHTMCNEVLAFDERSGNLVWSKVYSGPQSIVVDEGRKRVYIFGLWAWKRELLALNTKTGDEIWLNNSLNNERGAISTYVLPDGRIFALSAHGLLSVNPDTGQFGNALSLSLPRTSLPLIQNGWFWSLSDSGLEARDIDTGQVVWNSQYHGLSGCCLAQVYVGEHTLFLLHAGHLEALERQSGTLLWKFDEKTIVSNIVVTNNVLYGLSDDGTLLLLSVLTGNTLGYIRFQPPLSNAQESSPKLNGSQIVAREEWIAIYFADGELLSVYTIDHSSIDDQD